MFYQNMPVADVYRQCYRGTVPPTPGSKEATVAWLEAVNILDVWKVVQDWFEAMQRGEANNRYPDPAWANGDGPMKKDVTQEIADRLVVEMDEDFDLERTRFPGGRGPGFQRLAPHARLAFAQQYFAIVKTAQQLEAGAEDLLLRGVTLPP